MDASISLIDKLLQRLEEDPERILYRFLDLQNDTWTMRNITVRELYDRALEMAYMLRKKGRNKRGKI